MRKNFGPKTMCYPMPVFIIGTYNADGTPNAMNAAWGGISEEQEISICVDNSHKTAENLIARKAFTVSMATVDTLAACHQGCSCGAVERTHRQAIQLHCAIQRRVTSYRINHTSRILPPPTTYSPSYSTTA